MNHQRLKPMSLSGRQPCSSKDTMPHTLHLCAPPICTQPGQTQLGVCKSMGLCLVRFVELLSSALDHTSSTCTLCRRAPRHVSTANHSMLWKKHGLNMIGTNQSYKQTQQIISYMMLTWLVLQTSSLKVSLTCQCLKWRTPVVTSATPYLLQQSMASWSRMLPPGWAMAATPACKQQRSSCIDHM